MRIIFRIALVASLSLAYLGSNAQSFIVKGGLTLANMTIKDKNVTYSEDFKSKVGFHAGIAVDIPLFAGLSFEPGAMFVTKGYKLEKSTTVAGVTMKGEGTMNLNYIDVPLNLKYTLNLGNLNVWGSVGPYIGIGINGKSKASLTVGNDTKKEEADIKFGSDDDDHLKMLDYGLGLGVGAEFNHIILGLYYNIGMANLSNIDTDDYSTKNGTFNITLGYRIGGE